MHRTAVLGFALLGAVHVAPAAAQATPAEKATSLFLQAERAVAKGDYSKARTIYKRIATKYGETSAGQIASLRIRPNAFLGVSDIVRHGDSKNRVDVVVMGDGYTLKHLKALANLARVVPKLFERNETLGEYYRYHNFIRANVVSKDDGIDANGREYDTALGGRQSGNIQGQCTCDRRLVLEVLDQIEDSDGFAIVYVKQGVAGTGGGGVATVGGRGDATTIHEWGHAFAGLSDEYAQTTGHRAEVRGGINVTSDEKRVPWQHWLDRKARGIGVYQGANGQERGAWKPVASNCLMENGDRFCKVCREAMVLKIYRFVEPIDSCVPEAHQTEVGPARGEAAEPLVLDKAVEIRVQVMQPKSHALEVTWWIFPEGQAPRSPTRRGKDRSSRGPLPEISTKPHTRTSGRRGAHVLTLQPRSLEPGAYRVVCRARDTTKIRGDVLPWVLKDVRGVLVSERSWKLTVPPR